MDDAMLADVLLSVIRQVHDLKVSDKVEPNYVTLVELSRLLPRPWPPAMIREVAWRLCENGQIRIGNTLNDLYYEISMPS